MKKFKLTYTVEAENMKQVFTLALEAFEKTRIKPTLIKDSKGNIIHWNRKEAIPLIRKNKTESD